MSWSGTSRIAASVDRIVSFVSRICLRGVAMAPLFGWNHTTSRLLITRIGVT